MALLYQDSFGLSYKEGEMGDSQETLEAILGFLHREFIDPNYLERQIYMPHDSKFAFDNKLDDLGCSPKCAAH